jgi:hypothetical protein
MQAPRLDLASVLARLGYIPKSPTANVFLPTPNHSHVVVTTDINLEPIMWQVVPVLVTRPGDWPAENGSNGITARKAVLAAKAAGAAIIHPSRSSYPTGNRSLHMN